MLAQTDDAPALIKVKTAIMDADGDGFIDLRGDTVRIRASVTAEVYPAFVKDTREYRAYVQDRTGGIRVVASRAKSLRDLVVGVEAEITGTLGQYRGCPYLKVESIDEFRPSPEITPLQSSLETWDGEALTGRLVTVSGPVFYEDRRYFLGSAEGPRIRLFLRPSKNYVPFISQVRDGVFVNATGIAEQYAANGETTGGYRIRPRVITDLRVVPSGSGSAYLAYLIVGALALGGGWFSWRNRQGRQRAEAMRHQRIHALGTMAGGIAHEFNNYLLAITGFTELARMETKDAGIREHLDQVLKAGDRAKGLIEQILSFGSSSGDTELVATNAREAIQEAVALLRAVVPASVAVRTDLRSDGDVIQADRGQLSQLLLNLGTNAVHAMPNGGEFTVSLDRVELTSERSKELGLRDGSYVLLEVSDTGSGMDKETLQRIFDPFFTTRGRTEGTGLGLSVVHGIIKRHQGCIRVDSRPDAGTTFHIYLPITTESLATGSDVTTPEDVGNRSSRSQAGKSSRIMVVDDQDSIVQLVSRLCRSLGYEVAATRDAAEAESMFCAAPDDYHLLITDQTMPNMTGLQLVERVRHVAPKIPALLMTGNSTTVSKEQLARAGVDAVITKPFGYQQLAQHVEDLLAK